MDKRANGQPIIRLTSTRPINDPFVDLLLELNWPSGRLIREYTFLLDPPEFAAKNAAAAPAIVRPLAEASPPLEDRPARASSRSRASEQVQKPADGGATYEVKRGETLSKIASELRPEGVSLDQMLLGLFQANQNAFDGGDINRLKAGKILSVPDKATLETIPKGEARTVIVAQSSNWGTYRRKLATVAADAPGREEGARQAAAGKVTTRVEDRGGPAAEPKDQLKVSKTDLPGSKSLPASKRTDEDLIAKEKALRDANERLASLERNVAELQRLVELKSQNLADLERQSAAGSPEGSGASCDSPQTARDLLRPQGCQAVRRAGHRAVQRYRRYRQRVGKSGRDGPPTRFQKRLVWLGCAGGACAGDNRLPAGGRRWP
jgi:pilus assembly protein FimV